MCRVTIQVYEGPKKSIFYRNSNTICIVAIVNKQLLEKPFGGDIKFNTIVSNIFFRFIEKNDC